ncbi:BON domain-containing protein [Paucibacter sp. R3-3]|uniref:BON domain-containing protein n=1 Tax=Roseateles agri TaxID=3098619 RepID=A0ABU5DRS6_9BURK|nr:BON domain-containing protein [Paucibacter sp. R3-3]MDY0748443.1 BON domain-containing protein [Paucibacter sp. R3-3]
MQNSTIARLFAATLVSSFAFAAHAADVTAEQAAQPAAQAQQPAQSDAAIADKAKAALKASPDLAALPVEVGVKDGVVTVAGTVPAAAIEPVLKTVATVGGIKEIRNELKAG